MTNLDHVSGWAFVVLGGVKHLIRLKAHADVTMCREIACALM